MPQTKAQKQKIVEGLKDKMARQKAMVFVDVKGMKVKELSLLKKQLKAVNAQLQVVKKTLLGLVFKQAGFDMNPKEFPGQLALVFAFGDEIAPAGTLYKFGKTNRFLQIIGGYVEQRFRSAEEMTALAQLPSKQELLARAVGSIRAPLYGFAMVLQGNIKGLIYCLAKAKQ